jgi:hypothetical protein
VDHWPQRMIDLVQQRVTMDRVLTEADASLFQLLGQAASSSVSRLTHRA